LKDKEAEVLKGEMVKTVDPNNGEEQKKVK
jgi:hypothetical protein